MNIVEIIDKKRRGLTHTEEEIRALTRMMASGEARDYQIAAWLMAVCIRGLDTDETAWLTRAFVESGRQLDFSGLDGVVVDKHSTGGVGDKTTLALVPLLAAAGEAGHARIRVAKLSGRGLGFTGGTIDKLEAIPGFRTALSNERFAEQLARVGMALSSQTDDLAPADAAMYALRDVTATVESIPLVAASVVSKKIAAGADVIVLDIKHGAGAFMKTPEDARALAETCREVGRRLGRNVSTVISAMSQPLGCAIGHSLEVLETVRLLEGRGPADLETLCLTLGAVALIDAEHRMGLATEEARAMNRLRACLQNGMALAKFREWIIAQDGDPAFLEDPSRLPQARRIITLPAPRDGYVSELDALSVAKAAKLAGAGRLVKNAPIRLGVGVLLRKKIGDPVRAGESLAELHLDDPADTPDEAGALASLAAAFSFSADPVTPPPLLDEVVRASALA
jgi:pyrimidine-nucleoside phosphorylase